MTKASPLPRCLKCEGGNNNYHSLFCHLNKPSGKGQHKTWRVKYQDLTKRYQEVCALNAKNVVNRSELFDEVLLMMKNIVIGDFLYGDYLKDAKDLIRRAEGK